MKKLFSLLAALALCLSLAACGGGDDDPGDVVGGDWRVTGIVRDSGTITRNGEDTDVLVCVHADSADFYLDDEVQTLYDYVSYPITLQSDPWEAFQGIDFADRNGDGSSDAAILFELEGQQALMVWFWDAETETFVFQPEESLVEDFVDGDTAHQGLDGTWYLEGEDTAESVIGIGVAIPSALTMSPTSLPQPAKTDSTGVLPATTITTSVWTDRRGEIRRDIWQNRTGT